MNKHSYCIPSNQSKAWTCLCICAGTLLLIGATFKLTLPVPPAPQVVSRLNDYATTIAYLELALGAALVSGLWLRLSLWVSALAFSGFSVVSGVRAVSGQTSCGCFGALEVNPWMMCVGDMIFAALLALALYSGVGTKWVGFDWRGLPRRLVIPLVIVASCLALSGKLGQRLMLSEKLVILKPETWVGEEFPLSPFLEPMVDLGSGRWTILMYHQGCPSCERAIDDFANRANEKRDSKHRLLLIKAKQTAQSMPPKMPTASLSKKTQWFVRTPVEIGIIDGIVSYASWSLTSVAYRTNTTDLVSQGDVPPRDVRVPRRLLEYDPDSPD